MTREIKNIQIQLSELRNGNSHRPASNRNIGRRTRNTNSFISDRMAFSLRRVGRVAFSNEVEVREIDKNKSTRNSYFANSRNLK